ncbi:hypothetical protein PINS_up024589 [Pythium insidiosum]|nr:hypothetical protein PINS_up024589 [Pythium insidiosum]
MSVELPKHRPYCPPEWMDSEDLMFILYTSGSTGTPKGVAHTTAGYLLYTMLTTKYVFDLHDDDIHACVADCGWITGHSYIVYGPLANGATTVMFGVLPCTLILAATGISCSATRSRHSTRLQLRLGRSWRMGTST